jgi:hypothetical protein
MTTSLHFPAQVITLALCFQSTATCDGAAATSGAQSEAGIIPRGHAYGGLSRQHD